MSEESLIWMKNGINMGNAVNNKTDLNLIMELKYHLRTRLRDLTNPIPRFLLMTTATISGPSREPPESPAWHHV